MKIEHGMESRRKNTGRNVHQFDDWKKLTLLRIILKIV